MAQAFDRILIAVADLEDARAQYQALLGVETVARTNSHGVREAWVGVKNTVLALYEAETDAPIITGLVLRDAQSEARTVKNTLDLEVQVCDGSETDAFRASNPGAQSKAISVDHLVLRTQDAQGCIDLFSKELGVRLALDKTVPEWGGRMLFFRTGKMTLEVIESEVDETNSEGSRFWGIAFQHADLDGYSAELSQRGVIYSAVREGRKPGTRVATVKSHCLALPTLLIEPVQEVSR